MSKRNHRNPVDSFELTTDPAVRTGTGSFHLSTDIMTPVTASDSNSNRGRKYNYHSIFKIQIIIILW